MTQATLDMLVRELLLARTEDLSPQQMAAFVDGWTSLLDLVHRTDLTLPDASAEVLQAVHQVVDEIRSAQERVLGEELEPEPVASRARCRSSSD